MVARTACLAALGLVLVSSTVLGAPGSRRARRSHRPPPPPAAVDPADDPADEDGAAAAPDAKQVALDARDADADGDRDAGRADDPAPRRDTPAIARRERGPAEPGWQVSIGPYLWASSVDANVQLGAASAGVDIGFIPLVQHTRYGIEALGEVRHGHFALSGDIMYGAAGVTGSAEVASLMVTLAGNASSLLVDGAVSYELVGDQDAPLSLEARAGLRYQRTAVTSEVTVAGYGVMTPESVDDGSDGVVGARAVLRPLRWLSVSGMFDVGVVGVSDRTWSATGDIGLRVSSHVLISAGWRTLTMQRSRVSLSMQGPRAAIQLVF